MWKKVDGSSMARCLEGWVVKISRMFIKGSVSLLFFCQVSAEKRKTNDVRNSFFTKRMGRTFSKSNVHYWRNVTIMISVLSVVCLESIGNRDNGTIWSHAVFGQAVTTSITHFNASVPTVLVTHSVLDHWWWGYNGN